ncbi:MAG TPA: dienelactone hydrolase family protein, partial [Bauldia sp.]|nr:dienelactone hydrolase family protein [Bauldia sp.]
MGSMITLTAADGHKFSAYEAKPAGRPRGGLVVVQEIFGVNPHVRWVADGYAADGYDVIAPAIFDRAERDVELGYEGADREKAMALRAAVPVAETLQDVAAAVALLKRAGKVGIVGYCWGGTVAWLSAAKVDGLSAAIGYYGGAIAGNLDVTPRCPVLL